MVTSPNLNLDELVAQQSQPEVTHNSAIRKLDGLVQASVLNIDLVTPPGSPSDGDTHIIAGIGGDWSAFAIDDIVYYSSSSWVNLTPNGPIEGMLVYDKDTDGYYTFQGASAGWVLFASGSGESMSYDIGGFFVGTPEAGEVVLRLPMVRGLSFAEEMAGSKGAVGSAPSSIATFTLEKDGVEFGELIVSTGGVVTFTTDSNLEDFAVGDVLTVTGPSPASDLIGLGFTLKGTRT